MVPEGRLIRPQQDAKTGWMSDLTILDAIRELLTSRGIKFREVHHEPTFTSEQSAQARGEDLRTGGKALLMKGGDEQYRLFVLPADRRVDSAAIRKRLGLGRLRFASAEELKNLTCLVPGSVPPFGKPILPFELYLDEAIRANDRVAFNAGSLTDSIILSVADYVAVAAPTDCFAFSTPP
jgi:Ala-tRNA(Pro) deacylase